VPSFARRPAVALKLLLGRGDDLTVEAQAAPILAGMRSAPTLRVARALVHYRHQVVRGQISRAVLLEEADVPLATLRSAAGDIGARVDDPGLHFFDATGKGELKFGPGAGFVIGLSIGTSSLRAALVDAHGETVLFDALEPDEKQLKKSPPDLLEDVKKLAGNLVGRAFAEHPELLVDGRLPLLGVSVAWPCPVNRAGRPDGYALEHSRWKERALNDRLSRALGLKVRRCNSLNDTAAAAVAVAAERTIPIVHDDPHTRLTFVLRLAGGIGGATVIVERPMFDPEKPIKGFPNSILLGGRDLHAGEIGHIRIGDGQIDSLNKACERDRMDLDPIAAGRCSCAPREESTEIKHLQAYAGAEALAKRLRLGDPDAAALEALHERALDPRETRVLEDMGKLVAHALRGPIAVLDPAEIVITGSLALETVKKTIEEYLQDNEVFSAAPEVTRLDGNENRYVRARGAALVVVRRRLYRALPELVGEAKAEVRRARIEELTERFEEGTWSDSKSERKLAPSRGAEA
jgi:predicted NBD/HSP70 family sugar kinase